MHSAASFALTPGRRRPVSSIFTIRGMASISGSPAITAATSSPPAPMPIMPSAPALGVWLSVPTTSLPGCAKRARCTEWQMPLPARDTVIPYLRATLIR